MLVQHQPVLLHEVLAALSIEPDGTYIDATFGRGGHAEAVLDCLGPTGRLFAMDKDPEAVAFAKRVLGKDNRFTIVQSSFAMLEPQVQMWNITGEVHGILMDVGVSSPQLDDAVRGFSFRRNGPLDMRMNPLAGQSASQWLAHVAEQELIYIIKNYGEERFARRIARAIIIERQQAPITTTNRLAAIIRKASPFTEKGKDPATRTFQAIRIYINNELEELQQALLQAIPVLAPKGRLAVISFHSLEDRITKQFIRKFERGDDFPPDLPVTSSQLTPQLRRIGKVIKPGADELAMNVRARSACLRVAERLA